MSFDDLCDSKGGLFVGNSEDDMEVVVAQNSICIRDIAANTIDVASDVSPDGNQFLGVLEFAFAHVNLTDVGRHNYWLSRSLRTTLFARVYCPYPSVCTSYFVIGVSITLSLAWVVLGVGGPLLYTAKTDTGRLLPSG